MLYNGKGMQRLCEKTCKKLTLSGWEQINVQKILNAAGKANKELYLHLFRIQERTGHSMALKSKN